MEFSNLSIQKIYCIKKMFQASTTNHDVYDTLKTNFNTYAISCDKILERQRNFIITKHFTSIRIIFKKTWSTIKEH